MIFENFPDQQDNDWSRELSNELIQAGATLPPGMLDSIEHLSVLPLVY